MDYRREIVGLLGACGVAVALTQVVACGDSAHCHDTSFCPDSDDPGATTVTTSPGATTNASAATDSTTAGGTGGATAGTTAGSTSSSTSTGGGETTGASATGSTGPATTSGTTTGDATTDATTGAVDMSIPVHEIPGLVSITFYERTGGDAPTEYTFAVLGPELTTQLADPLNMNNRDIQGTSVEFYDVHYSDIDGNFDVDGSYLTIAGSFGAKLPSGGGLNLAEISLNYEDDSVEYGSFLASFVALGDNAAPDTAELAIDGDLQTHTTMGNNVDQPEMRLRVTLGFMSSLIPE